MAYPDYYPIAHIKPMQKFTPEIPYELAEWNKLFGEETAGALWQAHLAGHTDVIKDIGFWEQRIRDHGLPGDYFGFQYSLGNYFVDSHAKKHIEIIDALLFGYGSSEQPEIQVQCAKALNQKGWILRQKPSDPLGAMACYDTLLSLYEASNHPDLQIQCAQALFDKARTFDTNLLDLLRSDWIMNPNQAELAEIEIYDVLLSCYRISDTPEIQKLCAYALNRKGDLQRNHHNSQGAADTYNALVTHYGESKDLEIQALCIKAQYQEGCHRVWLGELPAALICYDELLSRYSQIIPPSRQAQCLRELIITADSLLAHSSWERAKWTKKIVDLESEIGIYDVLLSRYWSSYNPKIQELCAKVLLKYDLILGKDSQTRLNIYRALHTRYGNSKDIELQVLCAMALFNEGCYWTRERSFTAAFICYDKLQAQYSHIEHPKIQARCQRALVNSAEWMLILGMRQAAIQHMQKALGRANNKDQEFVVMRFLLWLAEAGTSPDEVLTAIRTLSPEVELTCGFKNIGPLVAALPEPRKTQAEYFLNFFKQHHDAGCFRKLAFPSGGPNEDFPSG